MAGFDRILIAGFGTMTGAMVEGWLAAGISAETFTVYNPRPKTVASGIDFRTMWPQESFDAIVLGMKPDQLSRAAASVNQACHRDTVILSVLGGVDLRTLQRAIPSAGAWVRFMPSLAVAIGKSPIGLIGAKLDEERRIAVTQLAEALGSAEWLADETLFNLVTALAGSGPGFIYRVIDALARAATELGLPADQANRLSLAMVEGAALLAAQSESAPADLARQVASPGGMTQAGLDVLDSQDALVELFTETLKATRDRGEALAQAAQKQL